MDALLFGETQSRVIVSTSAQESPKIRKAAEGFGLRVIELGKVGGTTLSVKLDQREFQWPLEQLHDAWWNSIARAMQV